MTSSKKNQDLFKTTPSKQYRDSVFQRVEPELSSYRKSPLQWLLQGPQISFALGLGLVALVFINSSEVPLPQKENLNNHLLAEIELIENLEVIEELELLEKLEELDTSS